MIDPNFDLMMWFILISWVIRSLRSIMLGAMGKKKEIKYNDGDVGAGLISIGLIAIIAFS